MLVGNSQFVRLRLVVTFTVLVYINRLSSRVYSLKYGRIGNAFNTTCNFHPSILFAGKFGGVVPYEAQSLLTNILFG
jgi:hypothetical protein